MQQLTPPTIPKLWCNTARAYEIARACGLKVRILYATEYSEAPEDCDTLTKYYGPHYFAPDGEIFTEIYRPSPNDYKPVKMSGETKEDVNRRADAVKDLPRPDQINPSAQAILDIAHNRFAFSYKDRERVKDIAATIALLDNPKAKEIRAEHIAEAIQYRNPLALTDVLTHGAREQALAAHLQTIFDTAPEESPIKNEVQALCELLEIEILM